MRVAFDIGGTFTDVIVFGDDGTLQTAKVLSLLDRVGEDIVAFVARSSPHPQVENVVHGTTIVSNAVIKIPRRWRLHHSGDELEMRGQRAEYLRRQLGALAPLVPRERRLEVHERILGNGVVERPLDVPQAKAAIQKLLDQDVAAIAVCFLNAYLNPRHEQQLHELIAEIAPHLVVCLSSEVHPEIREYERQYHGHQRLPIRWSGYLTLEHHLAAYSNQLLIMQSNGGIMTAQSARRRPMAMIESGPAAGVLAAGRLAIQADLPQALSFDMGGTTAKACLIEDGLPLEKPGGEVGEGATVATRLYGGGGHALRAPSLDIVEVGAGGGSIAWIDSGGALRVGPRSAGADPGPVCYSRGGAANRQSPMPMWSWAISTRSALPVRRAFDRS